MQMNSSLQTTKKSETAICNRFFKLDNLICKLAVEDNYYWFAAYLYVLNNKNLVDTVHISLNQISSYYYAHINREDRKHKEQFAEALIALTKEMTYQAEKDEEISQLLKPWDDDIVPDASRPKDDLYYAVCTTNLKSYFTMVYPTEITYIVDEITKSNIANIASRTSYDLPILLSLYYWMKMQCGIKENSNRGTYSNAYTYLGNLFHLSKNTVMKYYIKLSELGLIDIMAGHQGLQTHFYISDSWKTTPAALKLFEFLE